MIRRMQYWSAPPNQHLVAHHKILNYPPVTTDPNRIVSLQLTMETVKPPAR